MPEAVDIHVGKRLRQRRWQIGVTQKALAARTGVRFQQIQKYVTGSNRVSASRLWDIAKVLDVPVSYFFEGLQLNTGNTDKTGIAADLLTHRETSDLISFWYGMPPAQRTHLLALAKEMARRGSPNVQKAEAVDD